MNSSDEEQRLARFFAAHRESGLPVTSQRRAVFEAIQDRCDHPTAEQLYRDVQRRLPQISRMTVHRILGTFASLGLVARTCHPGSAARFDPRLGPHHHLVCLDCGRIMDVEDPRLNNLPVPEIDPREFQIQGYCVHFQGRCAHCHNRSRAKDKPRRAAAHPARQKRAKPQRSSVHQGRISRNLGRDHAQDS